MSELDNTLSLIMVKAHSAITRGFSRKEKIAILSEIIALAESQVHNGKTKNIKTKTKARSTRTRA